MTSIEQALNQLRIAVEEISLLSGSDLGMIEIFMTKKANEPVVRSLALLGLAKYSIVSDSFEGMGFRFLPLEE